MTRTRQVEAYFLPNMTAPVQANLSHTIDHVALTVRGFVLGTATSAWSIHPSCTVSENVEPRACLWLPTHDYEKPFPQLCITKQPSNTTNDRGSGRSSTNTPKKNEREKKEKKQMPITADRQKRRSLVTAESTRDRPPSSETPRA